MPLGKERVESIIKDWLLPTYRGQGAYYARGMKLRYSLLYWGGDDRGVEFPKDQNDLMFAIPVASHLTQAAGLAETVIGIAAVAFGKGRKCPRQVAQRPCGLVQMKRNGWTGPRQAYRLPPSARHWSKTGRTGWGWRACLMPAC